MYIWAMAQETLHGFSPDWQKTIQQLITNGENSRWSHRATLLFHRALVLYSMDRGGLGFCA